MASTWLARWVAEAGVSKTVVIKRILSTYASDEQFISMFINEARISTGLSHGNVAQVFDFGKVGEEYFLAMEYVDGQPLHHVLRQARTRGMVGLPLPEATFFALEMCRGLHYAHTRRDEQGRPLGIVHRDVSPDNVLVSYEGQVKVVDFGIAKARLLSTLETEPGVIKGKYAYCSPEHASGHEVDARTDVWATGVVLYQLLCGQLPFTGSVPQMVLQIVQGEFPRPRELRPDLPEELERILLKALAVKLPRRYPSAQAMGDDLSAFLNATAPRFSTVQVTHLMQELFRAELRAAGRPIQLTPALVTCSACGAPRTLTPRCPRCGNSYSQGGAPSTHVGPAAPSQAPLTRVGSAAPSEAPPPRVGPASPSEAPPPSAGPSPSSSLRTPPPSPAVSPSGGPRAFGALVLAGMARVLGQVRGEAPAAPGQAAQAAPLPPSQSYIAARMAGTEAEESPTPSGPTPAQQLSELSAAVEARDVPRAIELYTHLQLPVKRIPAACHLFVGQAASSREQYALAIQALEAAADAEPDGPLAPRALVLMARVLGERLGDTARAQQAYQYVLSRYPGTDAARFAQGQLSA
jgi:serine/threonine-protein kinase